MKRSGLTLLEAMIAVALFAVVVAGVLEALIGVADVSAVHEAEDDLAQEARRIRRFLQEEIAASGWHLASSADGDYQGNDPVADRALIYFPYVVQQSPDLADADLSGGLPTVLPSHAQATLRTSGSAVVSLAALRRDPALVRLPGLPEGLPGSPADATTAFRVGGLGSDERRIYAASFRARSQELAYLKVQTGTWAEDPDAQDAPVLNFEGDAAQWAHRFEDQPWGDFPHDAAGVLRMCDWDVKLDPVTNQRLGFRGGATDPSPLTGFEAANSIPKRTNRIDDLVLPGGWLSLDGGTVAVRTRWETRVATPKWAGNRLSSDDLRIYQIALLPGRFGYGRLVRAHSVSTASGLPPGPGIELGQYISADNASQTAMVIDRIISDDVVRIVFDTFRTVPGEAIGLNEVRCRLYLARPSSRRPELAVPLLVETAFALRANNNASANDELPVTFRECNLEFPY